MAHASIPSPRHESIQREACPNHIGFYRCGDFAACCALDPCGFLDFVDPCDAAMATLEDLDNNNNGGNDNGNGNGNGDGDGDGDDDNDGDSDSDGNGDSNGDSDSDGGDEELTSTARNSSTILLPPSSTKVAQTTSTVDNSETSSTPEIRPTSSSASLPFTSSVGAFSSLVANTTTFTTGTHAFTYHSSPLPPFNTCSSMLVLHDPLVIC